MPANENNGRVQGTLLQKELPDAGTIPAREQEGHHALRKGRASVANGVYLITRQHLNAESYLIILM